MVGGRLKPNQGVHLSLASRLQVTPGVGRTSEHSEEGMSEPQATRTTRAPRQLWVVGGFALLWNAMGARDYIMTQTKNEAYMSGFTPDPGGHLNFPHLWPGQTPPPGWRRNDWILGLGGSPDNSGRGLSQSPALALELEQVAVVHQTVKQRGDHDHVAQQFCPVLERAV